MPVVHFIHVAAVIAWFGSAASDMVLELALMRTRQPETQRAYINLHRILDLVLEGPGILLTLTSGLVLLWTAGLLEAGATWPQWLKWKVLLGGFAAAVNLACIIFVLARAHAAAASLGEALPLQIKSVRRWHIAVIWAVVAVPFALIALWLGVTHGVL